VSPASPSAQQDAKHDRDDINDLDDEEDDEEDANLEDEDGILDTAIVDLDPLTNQYPLLLPNIAENSVKCSHHQYLVRSSHHEKVRSTNTPVETKGSASYKSTYPR
jgi:hypothetical protein